MRSLVVTLAVVGVLCGLVIAARSPDGVAAPEIALLAPAHAVEHRYRVAEQEGPPPKAARVGHRRRLCVMSVGPCSDPHNCTMTCRCGYY